MSRPFKFCPRCATPLQATQYDGMTRVRCPDRACGFVHWNNPVPVVLAPAAWGAWLDPAMIDGAAALELLRANTIRAVTAVAVR